MFPSFLNVVKSVQILYNLEILSLFKEENMLDTLYGTGVQS